MIDVGPPPKLLARPALILPKPAEIVRPGDPRFVVPGMFVGTGLSGFGAGGGVSAVTRIVCGGAASGTDLTTYTFSAVDISPAPEAGNRKIAAMFTARAAASRSLSSCLIGGNAATVTTIVTGTSAIAIAVIDLPTGTTTVDVAPTWSGGMARCAVKLYALYGAASNTPTTTSSDATDPFTYSLTCAAGTVVLGAATDAATTTLTFNNLTENVDTTYETQVYGFGSEEFATAQSGLTLTIDPASSTSGAGGYAVFSPA